MWISTCRVLAVVCLVAGSSMTLQAADGPIAHWPLRRDAKDVGPSGLHARSHGGKLTFSTTDGVTLDGLDDWLEVPAHDALKLGTKDFTVSLWLHCEPNLDDVPGDLLSQFDSQKRRGWNLSLKSHSVTASQANMRTLHFGIDQDRLESKWTDHGQVGGGMFVKALAVFDGQLFAGTCEQGKDQAGHVYRFGGGQKWIDCGSPAPCNAVSAFAELDGKLYVGVSKYRLGGSAL